MEHRPKSVVDADIIIGYYNETDAHHESAQKLILSKKLDLFWTPLVIGECITVLSLRSGRLVALQLIHDIIHNRLDISRINLTVQIELAAIAVYRRLTTKNVSFTDCVNIALCESGEYSSVLGFDAIYKRIRVTP